MLVRVNKYSQKIKELSIIKRISIDYPLLIEDEVARKLANVAARLPEDINLQIDSAFRSLHTQQHLWNYRFSHMGEKARELVFNPENGIPPHCTGGAVDISLTDINGRELNLSEPFKKYYDEPQLISQKISAKAQKLRILLNKEMLDEGFVPNDKEYWHFSYGDIRWANYNKVQPLYTFQELPREMYFSSVRILFFKILRRICKLVNNILRLQTNY